MSDSAFKELKARTKLAEEDGRCFAAAADRGRSPNWGMRWLAGTGAADQEAVACCFVFLWTSYGAVRTEWGLQSVARAHFEFFDCYEDALVSRRADAARRIGSVAPSQEMGSP
ncbi:hypothetical protein HQ590_14135 [bacterium]|nr:hypothetical protein [bacterium]